MHVRQKPAVIIGTSFIKSILVAKDLSSNSTSLIAKINLEYS